VLIIVYSQSQHNINPYSGQSSVEKTIYKYRRKKKGKFPRTRLPMTTTSEGLASLDFCYRVGNELNCLVGLECRQVALRRLIFFFFFVLGEVWVSQVKCDGIRGGTRGKYGKPFF
jgi:hypothetical protein